MLTLKNLYMYIRKCIFNPILKRYLFMVLKNPPPKKKNGTKKKKKRINDGKIF